MSSTVEAAIPFPGFYNSILDVYFDETLEEIAQNYEQEFTGELLLLMKQIEVDEIRDHLVFCTKWRAAYQEMARIYTKLFKNWLLSELALPSDTYFEFVELWSPKFYNYETDRIYVEMDKKVIKKLLEQTPRESLGELINDRHSTRDGFVSFISNDINEWEAQEIEEWNPHQCETILEAWMEEHGHNVSDTENYISEDISSSFCIGSMIIGNLDEETLIKHIEKSIEEQKSEKTP